MSDKFDAKSNFKIGGINFDRRNSKPNDSAIRIESLFKDLLASKTSQEMFKEDPYLNISFEKYMPSISKPKTSISANSNLSLGTERSKSVAQNHYNLLYKTQRPAKIPDRLLRSKDARSIESKTLMSIQDHLNTSLENSVRSRTMSSRCPNSERKVKPEKLVKP